MDYFSSLRKSGKILEAYFEQTKDILHSASKGTVRETILNKVIRPYLPSCYGISSGEAFDKNGNTSKQLDIVIYDAVFSYTIPYTENFMHFPCESVYGIVEVKSKLDKEELNKAIDNIASIKALERESTHSWTVTPQVQISINGLPGDSGRNPYFGMIFAYDSTEVDTVLEYLKGINRPPQLLPNAIVLYSKKTIIIQGNGTQVEGFQKDIFDKYVSIYCGEDILAVFIGLLINYTRYVLLKTADIPRQTNSIMGELLLHSIAMGKTQQVLIPKSDG